MAKTKRPPFSDNLSIKNIYVGEIDTTIELDVGGVTSTRDFYNSYYVRNEEDLRRFLAGEKYFVYGQKGAGKTAFLRYVGEHLTRDPVVMGRYNLYRFLRDFPDQAQRDITTFVAKKRAAEGEVFDEKINIFRDIDYEDFWTFIILERVNDFLKGDGRGMVAQDDHLDQFQKMISTIDKGSIQDRFLRLAPKPQAAKLDLSIKPKATLEFEFREGDDLEKFSTYVKQLRERFAKLTWVAGFVNFMFDEIDPRVGSGKAFDLDCILIRDLIITIYKLNTSITDSPRRVVFSAAIRSEVLRSVEKLGKEVHKVLSQLGIHMNWGEYGRSDESNPLIKMLCKKIIYSESRAGIYVHKAGDDTETIWRKYFRKNNQDELSVKELLNLTWHKPRDIVRLLNVAKTIDGESKHFDQSLIARSKTVYANESWQEIQAQLVTSIAPHSVEALTLVLTQFYEEFTVWDLQSRIKELGVLHTQVGRLETEHRVGDLAELLYLHGILGNKDGTIHRFAFRGDYTPQITTGFLLHPGLKKKFSPRHRSPIVHVDRSVNGELDLG